MRWLLLLTLLRPAPAGAQVTAADSAAVLYGLAARLEAEGRAELAESLLELIRERYPLTPVAGEADRRLAALRAGRRDRSGRVELVVWSTLYGAWLGMAVPGALGADQAEAYGLGLLLGAPATFLLSNAYSRAHGVSEGRARAITLGGTWGTWQGFGWGEVLDLGEEQHCTQGGFNQPEYCYTETSTAARFASMIAGGLAGIAAGGLAARSREISPGTATVVNFGALWGSWYGLASGIVLDAEQGNDGDDRLLAWTLAGGNLGLLATALLAPRWQLSRGRARLISIAGVAGLVAGFGLDLLLTVDDETAAFLIPMATSAAGLAAGASWTR
ncbi:MAG: hypothetical protein HY703_01050 [Gemmatimonadetes bacterium]|nr:hypothetical protein [Gemmatimonadota bacterium]